MSGLQYYAYPGVGERNRETYGYHQAVRVGDRIECSGQGELVSSLPLARGWYAGTRRGIAELAKGRFLTWT